jgi:hypothetical protein
MTIDDKIAYNKLRSVAASSTGSGNRTIRPQIVEKTDVSHPAHPPARRISLVTRQRSCTLADHPDKDWHKINFN